MKKQMKKRVTAICMALGLTIMPFGQAFAGEETQTTVEIFSDVPSTEVEEVGESEVLEESELATEPELISESEGIEESAQQEVSEQVSESQISTEIEGETPEVFGVEGETSETIELQTQELETSESEVEEIIECETDTVIEGTLYNAFNSLSQEDYEQIQEQVSQIEQPQTYMAGSFSSISDCSSYLRDEMSLRYNYIMFNLYSSTYRSTSSMDTLQNTVFRNAVAHTGISYQGDAIYYDYDAGTYEVTRYSLGGGRYRYEFIYTIVYKTDAQQEMELRAVVQNKTSELCNGVSSEYEKVRRIYDYICSTVSYDYDNLLNDYHRLKYTAYAAMMNHTAVCQGYATLFYRMCAYAGISSRVITSTDHAWNIVRIGSSYYNVDSTWDAYDTPIARNYQYFLKSQADFPDHNREYPYNTYSFFSEYPMTQSSYAVPEEHRTFIGLYCIDGDWYYCKNGEIDGEFTDLVLYNGTWYYVCDGMLDWSYTGLAEHEGVFYQVKKGSVDWGYTGLSQDPNTGNWCYMEKGVHNKKYTGLTCYNGIWYGVRSGYLDWNYTGLMKYGKNWYYVQKGSVNWNYTGLTLYNGSWYYVHKGCVDWNYTGLVLYGGSWYYVRKGCLDWSYNGLVLYGGSWYYVQKGCLNWKYSGLTLYNNTWYYVDHGVLNWNYTGITEYYGTRYFVQKGVLNWGYSGSFVQNGYRYQIRYGRVV